MAKQFHEIRDPVHVFVRMDSDERKILNSKPFQRLRHIHQLAMTFLVYPGASHKRFEHSLGVMELASRVFDVVTNPHNLTDNTRNLVEQADSEDIRRYWRRVLRMAALCHDLGHLPFSHAAEKDLLPDGWDHERLTRAFIDSKELRSIWDGMTPPLRTEDIIKVALGPKKAKDLQFSDWETILSEIIVGDAFGVDRMDYLLRDSHHTGVTYGRFDHYRLIDTMRILTPPPVGDDDSSAEPVLGVDKGGIESAEALLLARYFMYSQVYFHPVRRIYDIHLMDFLKQWLDNAVFSTDISDILAMTDNEITTAIIKAAQKPKEKGYDPARRIMYREHFRLLYERNPDDAKATLTDPGKRIFEAARKKYGDDNVRYDPYKDKGEVQEFPVLMADNRIASSISISKVIKNVPLLSLEYVFVLPKLRGDAQKWLDENRESILAEEES